jgi:hypothetical protein
MKDDQRTTLGELQADELCCAVKNLPNPLSEGEKRGRSNYIAFVAPAEEATELF